MKIAYFYNLPPGGARRTVYEQVKYLSKNHDIELFTINTRSNDFLNPSEFTSNNNIYHFNLSNNLPGIFNRLYRDSKNFIFLKYLHRKIAADINCGGFDVLVAHTDQLTEAPFLLRFVNIPKIYYCHELIRIAYEDIFIFNEDVGILKKCYERLTRHIRKVIDRRNATSSDLIVTSSRFIKNKVENVYKVKAVCDYPGVDTKIFKRYDKKRKNQLLFMGNKLVNEGYYLAKEALEMIKKDNRPKLLMASFKRQGMQIENDKRLARVYGESMATLCLDYDEPFGLKAIESMACETPIIAVKEGGYKETVINDVNGLLVNRNKFKLRDAIKSLLNNPQLVERMGKAGRKCVNDYWRWDLHGEKLEEIIIKLIRF